MKSLALLSAVVLLLALAPLPIGYYTFLRIAVTLSAAIMISKEINSINMWCILFGITAIIFNPIIPIYLYQKSLWMPIDIAAAILFFSYSLKKQ